MGRMLTSDYVWAEIRFTASNLLFPFLYDPEDWTDDVPAASAASYARFSRLAPS